MYKLLCGLTALASGLLMFTGYVIVFSADWYVSYSTDILISLFGLLPSSVETWLANAAFFDIQFVFSLIQALVLSAIFAMLFGLFLALFKGLVAYVHFAILGVFSGFIYLVAPALLAFINSGALSGSAFNPLFTHSLITVLVWYLPLVVTIFVTANIKRRQYAQVERSWFH
ncbi:hypothetical protein VII00023_11986 [Vibrio ichthyoenteri ATCC 700023]|uniref:Uncharacterized protein n=1 Tax=Vibrio ichthyoenteri ATCC 700023 TaxID=870968 RepID=F9RYU6_9VIBR|nr:hypothetical protein [Vibrio ichthyoenteri]EGU46306.1 hypothetical protein VII00023_11986 [Vibrio ichthyoenteri ATCC 700023]